MTYCSGTPSAAHAQLMRWSTVETRSFARLQTWLILPGSTGRLVWRLHATRMGDRTTSRSNANS